MAHVIAPEATLDLDEIAFYIATQSGMDVARRWLDGIIERFTLLSKFPHLGRSRCNDLGPGRRSSIYGNYVILYRLQNGDVLILRIIHGRRDIDAAMG